MTYGQPSAVADLRTYKLVPGGGEAFDRIFSEGALPMLQRAGIHVVGYGPSLVDSDRYFLARAFASRYERDAQLAAFYGSHEWRENYDATVMQLIESYHTVVIPLTPSIVETLDVGGVRPSELDAVESLHELNDSYIRASVENDSGWYETHLSDDFVCTLSDGQHVDKARFMQRATAARGVTDVRHDETDVCLVGSDVALVRGVLHCARNGEHESVRYTGTWRLCDGRWLAIAAQLTPVA